MWPCGLAKGPMKLRFKLHLLRPVFCCTVRCAVAVREESGLHLEFCQRGATGGMKSFWSSPDEVVSKVSLELLMWGRHAPGALDGALAINTGNRVSLNEQQVDDCVMIDSTHDGQVIWTLISPLPTRIRWTLKMSTLLRDQRYMLVLAFGVLIIVAKDTLSLVKLVRNVESRSIRHDVLDSRSPAAAHSCQYRSGDDEGDVHRSMCELVAHRFQVRSQFPIFPRWCQKAVRTSVSAGH